MTEEEVKTIRERCERVRSGSADSAGFAEYVSGSGKDAFDLAAVDGPRLLDEVARLQAEASASRAALGAGCVEHAELSGHIDMLHDFVASLRVVISQVDRQRRRANWYEAAYDAGKAKLIEHATANIAAERDALRAEVERVDALRCEALTELAAKRAEVERTRPVCELARRWCKRPESVLRQGSEVLANDAELWRELRARVAASEAKESK